jgi:hypothetical protein
MYVPALLAQPALALTPVEIAFVGSPTSGSELKTALHVGAAGLDVLEGHRATVSGTLRSDLGAPHADPRSTGLPDRLVALQARTSRGWRAVARTRTAANGAFQLRYVPREPGSRAVRLRFAGDGSDLPSQRRLGSLNTYRLVEASWYGGGGGLACGGSLTPSTLGVANKTLPCGTWVTLRYAGRSLRVPVVDRGPYVAGREFDLTQATKEALGFGDIGELWSSR